VQIFSTKGPWQLALNVDVRLHENKLQCSQSEKLF